MSARRDIIRHHFPSHCSSPRLLAPYPINTVMGVSVGRLLTAVMAVAAPNLLGYQSVHPFRSCSPRPIDTRNGERDGERDGEGFVLVLGVVIRPAYPFNYVG